ncbi:NAD(P)-dependent dehydrogenase (short-subunit alcohol dehydrogenase family) [Caldalkalibacillus uzonensis]|uniref:NAD(P)-dependent dehydrogenase (Short-subunit alcohol dehydrogenase family) n=1 Tax=Caldalkalibacillus uzonensis TaxID=353224 RepID=A0ABU0CPB5_9BACI|nr:SDR family oxidoreductase [Caldalkalibacillus uzonensis]MDQ0338259.1 NAD(P)-dependent dehydrogenase (short-subunit alcohol dehydrogenase family) [Caldalkalibacillus uzonensis]
MKVPFKIDLNDKVAVVTGGSGVLGSTFCEALSICGAKVAVLGRTKAKLDQVVDKIQARGGRAIGVNADVLDKRALKKAKEEIIARLGPCDILINAAGGNHPKGTTTKDYFWPEELDQLGKEVTTFFDLNQEGIEYVFNLNYLGTLLPTQVFAQDMIGKQGATIINISSMSAFTPLTRVAAYSAAKAAISNFTQWLAVHFSKVGIRVNAIAPGFFLTEQNRNLLLNEDGSYTDRAKKIINQTPMGRFGKSEELIGTLLWLVDDHASGFVNGIVVPVDGGFSAYSGV